MLNLLFTGQIGTFLVIIVTIIFSLTLHEFGHALAARQLGDDTAERLGRLTINPVSHIDPIGLLMVVCVGFGYARPVPFNPRNIRQKWGQAAIAAAGPGMNLAIALISANLFAVFSQNGMIEPYGGAHTILVYLTFINILLMLFNLIPIGALDGHYIMEWLLPPRTAHQYRELNNRFGSMVFLALILLSISGLPIFSFLIGLAETVMPLLIFV